jgi:TRAP transporter TAXI family solute receptor
MKRAVLLVTGVCIILSAAMAAQDIGIATSNPGSFLHSSGTALAKLANDKAGIRATVQPYASPTVYLPAVNEGNPLLGVSNIFDLTFAYDGKDYFAGRTNRELRTIAVMYPLRNAIFVRKSSNYKKMADIKGQRMPDGYTSQKIIPPLIDALYSTAGFSRADTKPINVANVSAGADAFMAGKAEGFFFALGSAKVREADAAVGGLRALQIDATPANLARIQKIFPNSYFMLEQPGMDNPGIVEPVYSLAYDAVVFASAKTPDDIVYKITKAMYENKAELESSFASFKLFEPQAMAKNMSVPYHPGAIKFYKEKGMWPPK